MIVVMGKRLIWQNIGTAYVDTYQPAPLFYFFSANGEPEFIQSYFFRQIVLFTGGNRRNKKQKVDRVLHKK